MKKIVFSGILLLMILAFCELGLRAYYRVAPDQQLRHARPPVSFYDGETRMHPWSRGATNALRIAVLGDSITVGAGSQPQDAYGARLERLLNLNDGQRPAEVRVWARGGMCTFGELKFLEEAVAWKPELLILGICLNDTEDPRRKEELTRWRMDALPHQPSRWFARSLGWSRLATLVYQKLEDARARRGYLEMNRKLFDKEYGGWKLFTKALKDFSETTRRNNIKMVAVVFPLLSHIDDYPFDWIHEQVHEELDAAGIPYLDLLPVYKGLPSERLQAIPRVDAHPNEIGHRIAAEAILKYLLAEKLIYPEYLPAIASRSPEEQWRILSAFMNDVTAVKQDEADRLAGHGEPVAEPAPLTPE